MYTVSSEPLCGRLSGRVEGEICHVPIDYEGKPLKTLGSVREQFLFCMKPGGRVAVSKPFQHWLKPFPPRNVI